MIVLSKICNFIYDCLLVLSGIACIALIIHRLILLVN